jgi:citrate lyase subunit beta/citryl-CoA lyase
VSDQIASWLFVPGDRPDRFAKAAASAAHQVILDLEDAVSGADKSAAREAVAQWLAGRGRAWVRINARATDWHEEDLAAVADQSGLCGVVVPKCGTVDDLTEVGRRLAPGVPLLALVESAAGVAGATDLARAPGLLGLAFGSVDFLLDIDAEASEESLAFARGTLVVAARAAGLPGPIDSVCVETRDQAVVAAEAASARRRGFAGKLCVHPHQVEAVNAAFSPSEAEIAWASQVAAHAPDLTSGTGPGAFAIDGVMVDKPVLERARRILARADSASAADL